MAAAVAVVLIVLPAAGCSTCGDRPAVERAFQATWRGDMAAMRELLKAKPAMARAAQCGPSPGGLAWLLERASGSGPSTVLHVAARQGNAAMAQLLISGGADVNAHDSLLNTPLHLAAQYGHDEVIEVLLRAGADPNARRNGRLTALHLAAAHGEFGAAKRLLTAHAEVNPRDTLGWTPLKSAEMAGFADVARLLVAYGGTR